MDDRPASRSLPRGAADRVRRHPVRALPGPFLARHRRQLARRHPLRDGTTHGAVVRGRHALRHDGDPCGARLSAAAGPRHPRHRAARAQVRPQGRRDGADRDLPSRARDRGEAPQPLRLMANRWLIKTEPGTYSWADLEREGRTVWDGVKNPLALKHLAATAKGDEVLVYHTGDEKAVVGIAVI